MHRSPLSEAPSNEAASIDVTTSGISTVGSADNVTDSDVCKTQTMTLQQDLPVKPTGPTDNHELEVSQPICSGRNQSEDTIGDKNDALPAVPTNSSSPMKKLDDTPTKHVSSDRNQSYEMVSTPTKSTSTKLLSFDCL